MPAVLRPALRCVTRRTLTSVFDRLRSISLCRLRTLFRSPSCDALKIRRRSRRTSSSTGRHKIASQSRSSSRGPFTSSVSNLSASASDVNVILSIGSPGPRQHPSQGPGATWRHPVSGQLSAAHHWRSGVTDHGFLLPFGRRRWLLGPSCSRPGDRPSSRSAHRAQPGTRTGLPRSACARPGRGGCRLNPGAAVSTRPDKCLRSPPAASQRPALHPDPASTYPGLTLTRRQQRFTHVHPSGLPLACDPWMEQGPLGFSLELRTPPSRATHVEVGTGHRTLTRATSSTSPPTPNQRATQRMRPRVAPPAKCLPKETTEPSTSPVSRYATGTFAFSGGVSGHDP